MIPRVGEGAAADPSPYLEVRRADPVAWTPLQAESREDKPVLLSISHELNALSQSMGRDTFGNPEIAEQINTGTRPVAIDKNLHPAWTAFYRTYVWQAKRVDTLPFTVLTTPDFLPFEGGGYYPPTDDWGSQGLSTLVRVVSGQWEASPDEIHRKAKRAAADLDHSFGPASEPSLALEPGMLEMAVGHIADAFDAEYGGFGMAPRRIRFQELALLDLADRLELAIETVPPLEVMREKTLDALVRRGGRDFIRGGFFDSVVDDGWAIADFRKSAITQVDAILYFSRRPGWADLVESAARCLVRDFQNEHGLFSEHLVLVPREGSPAGEDNPSRAYAFSKAELAALLAPAQADVLFRTFGFEEAGNVSPDWDVLGEFEGLNLLRWEDGRLDTKAVQRVLAALREMQDREFRIQREAASSLETNARVALALFAAGKPFHPEATALVDRMARTFWDPAARRLAAAVVNGRPAGEEAAARGYGWFVRACLIAVRETGDRRLLEPALAAWEVLLERFGSEHGPLFVAPAETPAIPLNLYDFLESGASGSANSLALHNISLLRRLAPDAPGLGLAEVILNRLPEPLDYEPERYPDLLMAAFATEFVSDAG